VDVALALGHVGGVPVHSRRRDRGDGGAHPPFSKMRKEHLEGAPIERRGRMTMLFGDHGVDSAVFAAVAYAAN
jgi:hypothetical protein